MCCLTKATLAETPGCVWLWTVIGLTEKTISSFCHGKNALDHFLLLDSALFPDEKVTQPLCEHWHVPSSMSLKWVGQVNESSTACLVHMHLKAPKTRAVSNHVAKYVLEKPKTRKTARQYSVTEVQYQTWSAEATRYYEIHPKFVCIWEGNSFLSRCCERVWRNCLKWILEVPVEMLCSDLCNSLCHYGLLNIIIKDATLLHNIPRHNSWEQWLSLIATKHNTITFVLYIRAY